MARVESQLAQSVTTLPISTLGARLLRAHVDCPEFYTDATLTGEMLVRRRRDGLVIARGTYSGGRPKPRDRAAPGMDLSILADDELEFEVNWSKPVIFAVDYETMEGDRPVRESHSSVALVQDNHNTFTDADSGAIALLSDATAANGMLVAIFGSVATGTFEMPDGSVTDDNGNSYTAAIRGGVSSGTDDTGIFYDASIAAGPTTVTLDPTGTGNYFSFAILEISGQHTTSLIKATAAATPTGTANPSTGAFTANGASGDLKLVVCCENTGNINLAIDTFDPVYTLIYEIDISGGASIPGSIDYRVETGVEDAAATWTSSVTDTWSCCGVIVAAAGAGGAVELAGNQPAASGALASALTIQPAGSQPAASGALGPLAGSFATLGNQPAASGALATAHRVFVAGSQPAASGALGWLQAVFLAGAQPAPSGALALQALIQLAGNQPAPAGVLEADTGAITLAGNQPAAAGALAALHGLVQLLGQQPAPAGALGPLAATIAVLGNQPAGTGALEALAGIVALAGAQPAPSGVLGPLTGTWQLAGVQPAATGSLEHLYMLVTLAGSQPAASGVLGLLAAIALFGNQPAPSGALAAQAAASIGDVSFAVVAEGSVAFAVVAEGSVAFAVEIV